MIPKLITAKELYAMIPYSSVHIWRLEKKGEFPRRINLGRNRIAWLETEIAEWLESKKGVPSDAEQIQDTSAQAPTPRSERG